MPSVATSYSEPYALSSDRPSDTYSQMISSHLSIITAHFSPSIPQQSKHVGLHPNSVRVQPNRVLDQLPPSISEAETLPTRPALVALSQLRSGFCSPLVDYRARIGATDSSLCPDCETNPDSRPRLLLPCQSHPLGAPGSVKEACRGGGVPFL